MLQPTHCCWLMLGIAMAPEAAGLPVRLLPLGRMISWPVGVPPLSVLAACPISDDESCHQPMTTLICCHRELLYYPTQPAQSHRKLKIRAALHKYFYIE